MSWTAGYPAPLIGSVSFLLGLVLGSFGNVLILRLPAGESIRGRSRCPQCKQTLAAFELIPLLSYVFLRGKCRHCGARISAQYPIIELLSGVLAVIAVFHATSALSALVLGLALWVLLLIAVVDAHIQGIPDLLSGIFIVLALVYGALNGGFDSYAFAIGVGFFGAQWIVSRGRWIGSGDVLLSVGLSALLQRGVIVLLMLFAAYIIGALFASVLLLAKRINRRDYIAFGPFLALGTVIALLWGDRAASCLLLSTHACIELPFFR